MAIPHSMVIMASGIEIGTIMLLLTRRRASMLVVMGVRVLVYESNNYIVSIKSTCSTSLKSTLIRTSGDIMVLRAFSMLSRLIMAVVVEMQSVFGLV